MIWPDEVREADFGFLDEDIELRPQEQQMAALAGREHGRRLRPRGVHRQLPRGAQEVIEAKVEGREVVEAEEAQPTAGNVVDLMSALRASVDAAKKGRGEAPAKRPTAPAKKAPAKKAAAKKAPAKKAAGEEGAGQEGAGQEGRGEEGPGQEGGRRRRPARKSPDVSADRQCRKPTGAPKRPPRGCPTPSWRRSTTRSRIWPGRHVAGRRRRACYVRTTPTDAPDAEPALFVHGLGGSSHNWTDFAGVLRNHLAIDAIDLPGHGRSGPGAGRDYRRRRTPTS